MGLDLQLDVAPQLARRLVGSHGRTLPLSQNCVGPKKASAANSDVTFLDSLYPLLAHFVIDPKAVWKEMLHSIGQVAWPTKQLNAKISCFPKTWHIRLSGVLECMPFNAAGTGSRLFLPLPPPLPFFGCFLTLSSDPSPCLCSCSPLFLGGLSSNFTFTGAMGRGSMKYVTETSFSSCAM